MNHEQSAENESVQQTPGNLSGDKGEDALEETGPVTARHGGINGWLLVVYVIMLAWSVYYAIEFWSLPGYDELGPGLGDY